jgi:MFS family permease
MPFAWRLSPIWRQRDFRLLWIGETISVLGSGVSDFALPLVAVVTLHVTPGQLGLLRALGAAPGIVLGLFAGVWVDRVSRQRLLIALNVLAAMLVLSIPVANAIGSIAMVHLYALWIAFGFLGPFWWTAWNSFLPSIVEPQNLVEANSKVLISWSANGIVGPALGGVLVALLSAPNALLVDSASFLVCAAFTVAIRPPRAFEADPTPPPVFGQIIEGIRETFLDRLQRAITTPRLILDFIDALAAAVFVIYAIREVGLNAALLGTALALSAVGFVAGSLIAPRVERRLGIGAMIVLGLGMVAASPYTMILANRGLPIPVNVVFLAIPGWVGGLGGVLQFVGLSSLRQSITPDRLLGRVFASATVASRILTVLGALTGGLLGGTIGLRPTIAFAAVAYSVPFLYSLGSPLRTASSLVSEEQTVR